MHNKLYDTPWVMGKIFYTSCLEAIMVPTSPVALTPAGLDDTIIRS